MRVITSHLAMRFYVHDGWTQEILDSITVKGRCTMPHPEDVQPYFILPVGSSLDMDKLMKLVTSVTRWMPGVDHLKNNREYLEGFNG